MTPPLPIPTRQSEPLLSGPTGPAPSLRCEALPIRPATTTLRKKATARTTDRARPFVVRPPGSGPRSGDLTS